MSELNTNAIPAINAVEGFNPADFVRNTVGEEGENDLYLDVKYRLLWFRLHCPNGKIDPELVHLDEKSAVVCCKVYADKADPADQFIGKAYSQRFPTEERFWRSLPGDSRNGGKRACAGRCRLWYAVLHEWRNPWRASSLTLPSKCRLMKTPDIREM